MAEQERMTPLLLKASTTLNRLLITLLSITCCLTGCERKADNAGETRSADDSQGTGEHIDAAEKAAAAKLSPAKDPVLQEISQFRREIRKAYNERYFDELERRAAEFRASKEVFGNGSWKSVQFYSSFELRDNEPESAYANHDQIYRDWLTAHPKSIAAHVAYAEFLTDYAWKARGSGYADTVSEAGFKLFQDRLAAAFKKLEESRNLEQKDPNWWRVALTVALGQQWPKEPYDRLVIEGTTFEPTFWGIDTARAYSLLPRWYGKPGDWENYAEEAAARPNGLGAEVYARIVINMRRFHENIFRGTKVSWPRTKEGLAKMREKHPESLEILSQSAQLACMAEDRELAKETFALLGDRYLPSVWGKPERFVHNRTWAETGKW